MYAQQMTTPQSAGIDIISSDPEAIALAAAEVSLAKRCAEYLEQKLPGRGWMVTADLRKSVGMVYIKSTRIVGPWGVNMHAKSMDAEAGFAKMHTLCGEMLERFHMTTGRTVQAFDQPIKTPER